MSTERDAALRRIAIVLSSLPAPVAMRLLGELDAESKRAVRHTMTSLEDVDPLERKRALQAFSGSLRKQASSTPTQADEVHLSATRVSLPNPSPSHRNGSSDREPSSFSSDVNQHFASLSFLADVQDDLLVRLVAGEHPQTVALVLASIAPAQAARILPRLGPTLRSDAMSRISRLGEIPAELVEELATHLRSRVAATLSTQANAEGQRRLSAILAAMPTDPNPHANRSPMNVRESDGDQRPALPARAEEMQSGDTLRIFPASSSDPVVRGNTPSPSTDEIHQELVSMPPVQLRDALAEVDVRTALLTLCGLPTSTADAVLATLPRAQSRQIRSQLNNIGSLQLREIDAAKEQVARAAMRSASPSHLSRIPVAA